MKTFRLITRRALSEEVEYWLTPVQTLERIHTLVGKESIYALGNCSRNAKRIKPQDWICFYNTKKGVVAHAKVVSSPVKERHEAVRDPKGLFPWIFKVSEQKLYFDEPIAIDAELRRRLEEFKDRDPLQNWGWYVRSTRKITKHDFEVLTGIRT